MRVRAHYPHVGLGMFETVLDSTAGSWETEDGRFIVCKLLRHGRTGAPAKGAPWRLMANRLQPGVSRQASSQNLHFQVSSTYGQDTMRRPHEEYLAARKLLRAHGLAEQEFPTRRDALSALEVALLIENDRLSRDHPYGDDSERDKRPGGIPLWTGPAPDTKAVKSHKENA